MVEFNTTTTFGDVEALSTRPLFSIAEGQPRAVAGVGSEKKGEIGFDE